MPLAKLRNENAAAKSTRRNRVSIKTYWIPQHAAESNAYPHQVMGIVLSDFGALTPVDRSRHRELETRCRPRLLISEASFVRSCQGEYSPPGTRFCRSNPLENRLGYNHGALMADEQAGQAFASPQQLRGRCRPEKSPRRHLADTCFRNRKCLTTSE